MLLLLQTVFVIGGRLTPALTGRLACRYWYQTTRFPWPSVEKKALLEAEREFEQINDSRIATYTWGNTGALVLLVHGWNGRATQLAPFVPPLLNAGFRVLGFDAPAHGRSAGRRTNIFEIAKVLNELNRRRGPIRAVITHSFGGPSLALAMKQGFSTERIVCLSPPADAAGLVAKFAHRLQIPDKSVRVMKQLVERRFGENVWSEISMLTNVADQFTPALILHDEDDRDIPWREGHAVSQAWPGARFQKTRKLGHHRILRDKTSIRNAVDFIVGDTEVSGAP